jgi:hypothetical protein
MSEQQIKQIANVTPAPALKLIFDGLFFFCFNTLGNPAVIDPASECRVGFITTAPQHVITISGTQTDPNGIKTEFEIPLTHAQARSIQIDLDVPGVTSPCITRKGHRDPINRATPTEDTKEFFKWIIDLENNEMHNVRLPLIQNVLKPVMHINIGEFYTEKLSIVKYFRTRVDTPDTDFGNVAACTGVRIATLPQNRAYLNVGTSTVPLVTQPGATCEVVIKNRCPACDIDHQVIRDLHLSDFPHHYDAFNVNALSQFDFDYEDTHAFPPAICYAASGSQTTDI